MKITLDIPDDQMTALSAVAADPVEWITNAISARADHAAGVAKAKPEWNAIVVSASKAGVDIANDQAILAHGVNSGVIKTAKQRNDEAQAAVKL